MNIDCETLPLAQHYHQQLRHILSSMRIRGVVIIHCKNVSTLRSECIEHKQSNEFMCSLLQHSLKRLTISVELFKCHDEKTMKSVTQNGLGIERDDVIFDATLGFDLTAFAAIAGSLKSGAILWLMIPEFSTWENSTDITSLRWNDAPYSQLANPQAIVPLNFIKHFQDCCKDDLALFPVKADSNFDLNNIKEFTEQILQPYTKKLEQFKNSLDPHKSYLNFSLQDKSNTANKEQSYIIEQCIKEPVELSLLFAKRGRGKSWLLTELIRQLNILGTESYLTVPNKEANLSATLQSNNFIAPDELTRLCSFHETESLGIIAQWLFIDEAAMLPISQIKAWLPYFKYVLLVSTVEGYEGSGQGLRFKLNTLNSFPRVFTLNQPIRYSINDPLENFVEQLCMLPNKRLIESYETETKSLANRTKIGSLYIPNSIDFKFISDQLNNIDTNEIRALYQLLYSAHYKTTPTDLRRILDAPNQQFIIGYQQSSHKHSAKKIIAGCWVLNEGGADIPLAKKIWAGLRRPKGNLLAQSLTTHAGLIDACVLKSWRITRIAVEEQYRRNQLSTQMLTLLKEKAINHNIDFISVSFGYEEGLYKFWQANNFSLTHVSFTEDASSGALSCMMIYPLSIKGRDLLRHANKYLAQYLTQYAENSLSVQNLLEIQRFELIKQLILSQKLELPSKTNLSLEKPDFFLLLAFAKHNRLINTIFPVLSKILMWDTFTKKEHKWDKYDLDLLLSESIYSQSNNLSIMHNKQLVTKKLRERFLRWLQAEYPAVCDSFDNWMTNDDLD